MEAQREKLNDIENAKEVVNKCTVVQREAEEQRAKKHMRLQLMNESSKITDQSCEDVNKRLAREKNIYNELVMKRVSLDQELDELNTECRLAVCELSQKQKAFEKLKRQFKKTQMGKESVDESIGPLQLNKKDIHKQSK